MYNLLYISKSAFKKAIGFLLKKNFVKQTENGTKVIGN